MDAAEQLPNDAKKGSTMISDKLLALRKRKGMSQQEVADASV